VGVGPLVSKYLADHGAEVIRIESSTYPETLRRVGPFVGGVPGVDNSGYFANFNSSKYGVTLNLKHPRGPELARQLVAKCDIVTESYTPGIMARYGLDYASLSKDRDDLLMISMPLYGQTGPWGPYMGYGHVLQAASGINHLTGWPEDPPIGTGIAYTDFLVPHIAAIGLIAALDYRRRTGKGQYIDFGQFEAAVHGLGTAVLDWTVNGHNQTRMGNHDIEAAPHNCYRAQDGRYVVIACETEDRPVMATLAALVPGAAAGLIRDAILVDRNASEAIARVADVASRYLLRNRRTVVLVRSDLGAVAA
jgi:crotonobetainyl-CoA:carnitine CoA-transferase CaiB-like acyl-CoA transferase